MYDEWMLEESFDQLINSFDINNVYDFASKLYLVESKDTSYIGPLEKLVYTIGDSTEVYTKKERDFISKVSETIMFAPFDLNGKKSKVQCSLIAVDLSEFIDPIYNSIAFMKICNKALTGFNIYLITTKESVFIGHDYLTNNYSVGCNISYPVAKKVDWVSLQNNFLYINSQDFKTFYCSLCDAVALVYECYENNIEINDSIYYFDEENSEYIIYRNSDEFDEQRYLQNSNESFLREVDDSQRDLKFIRTNKVNTMELLIDAERAEEHFDSTESLPDSSEKSSSLDLLAYSELLDDPEMLIKIFKKRNV